MSYQSEGDVRANKVFADVVPNYSGVCVCFPRSALMVSDSKLTECFPRAGLREVLIVRTSGLVRSLIGFWRLSRARRVDTQPKN